MERNLSCRVSHSQRFNVGDSNSKVVAAQVDSLVGMGRSGASNFGAHSGLGSEWLFRGLPPLWRVPKDSLQSYALGYCGFALNDFRSDGEGAFRLTWLQLRGERGMRINCSVLPHKLEAYYPSDWRITTNVTSISLLISSVCMDVFEII